MASRGRSQTLLPSPVVTGAALIVLAMGVLLTVGTHAASLGDDPSWAWDCNDTTCEDLWAQARAHYLRVAASCGLALPVGWAILGLGLPSSPLTADWHLAPRTRRAPRAGWLVVLMAPVVSIALGALLALGSRPWGLAGAGGVMLLSGLCAWRDLESRGCSRRYAWYSAGATAVLAALIALGVLVLAALIAFGMAGVGLSPPTLWMIPAGPIAGGATGAAVHLLQCRRLPARASAIEPESRTSPRSPFHLRGADVICALVLLGASVWAAWPVPAPPADAWMYGAPL